MSLRARETLIVVVYVLVHVAAALAFVLRRDPGTDAAWVGFPLDDAWIHHVYARSLAHGGLFEYVPGRPEAGFTSPLWAIVLAPIWWFTDEPRVAALACKALGVVIAIAVSLAADRLATRLSSARWAGVIAGLAIAIDPALTFASVSGMEVMLAALAMLVAVHAWLEERWSIAGAALAASLISRPECALVVIVMGAAESQRTRDRPSWPTLAKLIAPTLGVGALWSGFCLWVAGRPLPNTFYAKRHPHSLLDTFSDAPRIFGPQLLDQSWFFVGSGFVLLALAARRLTRDGAIGRERAITLCAVPIVFLLGVAWAHDILWLRAFAVLRYTLPHLPWTIALIAVGAHEAITLVRAAKNTWRDRAIAALSALALVLPLVVLPYRFDRSASAYAWNAQNIEEMQVRVGEWLRAHTTDGEWVATHDAGAIRIFSGRRVLDLAGLNEHRMHALGTDLFAEVRPRYFAVFPTWFPRMAASPRYRGVFSASASHYTICPCTSTELRVLEPIAARSVTESEDDLEGSP